MENYIVRIYRRKDENGGLFGVVEEVGVDGKRAFQSMEDLLRILEVDRSGDRPRIDREPRGSGER